MDRAEGDHPFGEVAHPDGNTVALVHLVAVDQRRPQGVNARHDLGVAPTLVLVDEEDVVTTTASQVEELPQAFGGIAKPPLAEATDRQVGDLVELPRRGDVGHRFLEAPDAHLTSN